MAEITITVPGLPPSVNAYVRHTRGGGHYRTAAAKRWDETVAYLVLGRKLSHEPQAIYGIEITVVLGPGQKMDLDNAAKVPIDSLVRCGAIRSDAAVWSIRLNKSRAAEAVTIISAWDRGNRDK